MRYSDIENINLGHRQVSFGFENNLSQEQNAVMECLADQIKQRPLSCFFSDLQICYLLEFLESVNTIN